MLGCVSAGRDGRWEPGVPAGGQLRPVAMTEGWQYHKRETAEPSEGVRSHGPQNHGHLCSEPEPTVSPLKGIRVPWVPHQDLSPVPLGGTEEVTHHSDHPRVQCRRRGGGPSLEPTPALPVPGQAAPAGPTHSRRVLERVGCGDGRLRLSRRPLEQTGVTRESLAGRNHKYKWPRPKLRPG